MRYRIDFSKFDLIKLGSRGSYTAVVETSMVACFCVSRLLRRATGGLAYTRHNFLKRPKLKIAAGALLQLPPGLSRRGVNPRFRLVNGTAP